MIVTVHDCRKIGFCVSGQKKWFAKHDLDFRDFVKNGISFEKLKRIDDEHMNRAMAQAKRRIEGG